MVPMTGNGKYCTRDASRRRPVIIRAIPSRAVEEHSVTRVVDKTACEHSKLSKLLQTDVDFTNFTTLVAILDKKINPWMEKKRVRIINIYQEVRKVRHLELDLAKQKLQK